MALREFPSQYASALGPYYALFFSLQDFCIALSSNVAHLKQVIIFTEPLCKQLSQCSYMGLQAMALGWKEVGDRQIDEL